MLVRFKRKKSAGTHRQMPGEWKSSVQAEPLKGN